MTEQNDRATRRVLLAFFLAAALGSAAIAACAWWLCLTE